MFDAQITLRELDTDLDALCTLTGIPIPETVALRRAGMATAAALRTADVSTVSDAIATGDPDTITAAITTYTTAQAWAADHDATNALAAAALAATRVAAREIAPAIYAAIAERFNAAAKLLNADAKTVDITAPAERVISASHKERSAWEFAPAHANEVEQLAQLLATTAILAGCTLAHTSHTTNTDRLTAVTLDTLNADRRALWTAWDSTDHRAGRFGALATAGFTIAAPTLDSIAPYRRPKPMETDYVPTRFGHRPVTKDPETGQRFNPDGTPFNG